MFTYVHDNKGETPAIEMLLVDSTAIKLGMPLKLSSGKLVVCGTNSDLPLFIANADAAGDTYAPVVRVTPTQKWRTTLSASNSGAIGAKSYLGTSTNVGTIGAANDSGHAVLEWKAGGSSGDEVIVHFE